MAPTSDAKRRATDKWNKANMKENYDHHHLLFAKGKKAIAVARAKELGLSLNAYIAKAIDIEMEQP